MISRLQIYWEMLTTNPLGFLIYVLYFTLVALISLILHECAHGYVAWRCGDPTARMMGRLTLDPRAHLDPIGTVCMVLLGFGWAKPVPVNPRNFKGNYRWNDFFVSIAGIVTNLCLFLICSSLAVGINRLIWREDVLEGFQRYYGSVQGLLNPYASSGMYASYIMYGLDMRELYDMAARPWLLYVQKFLLMMSTMNLSLAIFNFLPIPPLDGYHIFNDLLLKGRFQLDYQGFRIAQVVLLVLMMTGVLSSVLSAANSTVYGAVIDMWMWMAGA